MTYNLSPHRSAWLAQIGASRHKLVLLTGAQDTSVAIANVRRMVPGCDALNLGLALSQRLLDAPSHRRPTQAPILLADLLQGQEPLLLYAIEILFDPSLQLEPLRALQAASRSRILLVLWPGAYDHHTLTYAVPDHPEYRRYGPDDLADVLVIPAAELTPEA